MLTVIELIQLTFAIYKRNFGLYVGYSAWLLIPSAIIYFGALVAGGEQNLTFLIGQVVIFVLTIGIWIILAIITAKIVGRKKINAEELSKATMDLLWPVFWIGLVAALVQVVGLLLLIIPGIIAMVWYAFATLEVVLGGHRGLSAMSASRDLVRGRFWSVLWRLVAGPLILMAVYVAFSTSLISLVEMLTTGSVSLFTDSLSLSAQMLGSIMDAVVLPIFVIYPTLLYLDLKSPAPAKPAK